MPTFEAESPVESVAVRESRFVACLAFDYRTLVGKVKLQLARVRGGVKSSKGGAKSVGGKGRDISLHHGKVGIYWRNISKLERKVAPFVF